MNVQPMIEELLLIRRGLGEVNYSQSTFASCDKGYRANTKHPCGTVCCMAGIAAYKKVGIKYLTLDSWEVAHMGAEMLGLRQNEDHEYDVFSTSSSWPRLVREMYHVALTEEARIDAAICALRLVNDKGNFRKSMSERKQREVIAERLKEVATEAQEMSELGKLLKEVELEAEPDRKLLRRSGKDSHEQKNLPVPSRTGRKRVAVKSPKAVRVS